jgi:hypothetical protein
VKIHWHRRPAEKKIPSRIGEMPSDAGTAIRGKTKFLRSNRPTLPEVLRRTFQHNRSGADIGLSAVRAAAHTKNPPLVCDGPLTKVRTSQVRGCRETSTLPLVRPVHPRRATNRRAGRRRYRRGAFQQMGASPVPSRRRRTGLVILTQCEYPPRIGNLSQPLCCNGLTRSRRMFSLCSQIRRARDVGSGEA